MDIEQEGSLVEQSRNSHQQASYYLSHNPLSKETQELLHTKELITSGGQPQLVQTQQQIKKEIVNKGIIKYKYMNDGMWMKVLIDRNDYPEIRNVKMEDIKCDFHDRSFELTIKVNEELFYHLKIERTWLEIIPEKCKIYERKSLIYIGLYKAKEQDWYNLK